MKSTVISHLAAIYLGILLAGNGLASPVPGTSLAVRDDINHLAARAEAPHASVARAEDAPNSAAKGVDELGLLVPRAISATGIVPAPGGQGFYRILGSLVFTMTTSVAGVVKLTIGNAAKTAVGYVVTDHTAFDMVTASVAASSTIVVSGINFSPGDSVTFTSNS